jgi:hypothetical protein
MMMKRLAWFFMILLIFLCAIIGSALDSALPSTFKERWPCSMPMMFDVSPYDSGARNSGARSTHHWIYSACDWQTQVCNIV